MDPKNLPAAYDRTVDLDIPRALWCGFVVHGRPRMIRRELTDGERSALERRAAELEPALAPFARPREDDAVALALTEMYGSFPSMKGSGAESVGKIMLAMEYLSPFPVWAICKACADIRADGYEVRDRDGVRRERHWPPSDSEILSEVRAVVKLRADALASARALLDAPIDR